MTRGELMLARKDNVEQHCFDKAVQLDPDWLVLVEIAAIYIFYSRHAKALARCRQAVEKAPDEAYCWFQQACCQRAMGLNDAAKRSFKQCLDLQPKHSQARLQLMELEASGKSIGGAIKRLFGRG
jgi:tetratricopeptide (TPR) repeat protein